MADEEDHLIHLSTWWTHEKNPFLLKNNQGKKTQMVGVQVLLKRFYGQPHASSKHFGNSFIWELSSCYSLMLLEIQMRLGMWLSVFSVPHGLSQIFIGSLWSSGIFVESSPFLCFLACLYFSTYALIRFPTFTGLISPLLLWQTLWTKDIYLKKKIVIYIKKKKKSFGVWFAHLLNSFTENLFVFILVDVPPLVERLDGQLHFFNGSFLHVQLFQILWGE